MSCFGRLLINGNAAWTWRTIDVTRDDLKVGILEPAMAKINRPLTSATVVATILCIIDDIKIQPPQQQQDLPAGEWWGILATE